MVPVTLAREHGPGAGIPACSLDHRSNASTPTTGPRKAHVSRPLRDGRKAPRWNRVVVQVGNVLTEDLGRLVPRKGRTVARNDYIRLSDQPAQPLQRRSVERLVGPGRQ